VNEKAMGGKNTKDWGTQALNPKPKLYYPLILSPTFLEDLLTIFGGHLIS
jgi:hypothetical protein